MHLLAQSAAKINAMEDRNVIKRKLKIKMLSSAECQDTASIVYYYLQGVSPTTASTLLDIYPEVDRVDTSCNFILEEVVQAWKSKTAKEVSKNSKSDIDNSVGQYVVKFDAIEALKVKKTTFETKITGNALCLDLDTVSMVYHYMQGVNPTIASLFLEIHPEVVDIPCNITLEEVVLKYWAYQRDERRDDSVSQLKVKVKEKVGKNKDQLERLKRKANNIDTAHEEVIIKEGHDKSFTYVRRAFTPGEDEIIRNKLEEMGGDLNIGELAEEIGRNSGSVWNRINKLKSGEARRKQKSFSLAEDEAIMEKVLPGLQENKLHELVLHQDRSLKDLAIALGRPNKAISLAHRWVRKLQPWIMQHYAGTLNLDIRMMLVSHLGETYRSRESIDWDAVVAKYIRPSS